MTVHDAPDPTATLELLRKGVGGDRECLSRLWQAHLPRLEKLVNLRLDRRIRGRVDAEDVLQESFLDFSARAQEYIENPEMPFFLWLRFLTGQRLKMIHRKHLGTQMRDAGREVSIHRGTMPQATSLSLAAQLLGRFTSVTQAVQRAELQEILNQAVNAMDPVEREILALRHFEELSNAETAAVMGIKKSTASTKHVRALKRLREQLERTPGFFDQECD